MNCHYASTPHSPPLNHNIFQSHFQRITFLGAASKRISGKTFQFPGRANFPQSLLHTCLTNTGCLHSITSVPLLPDEIHSQVFEDTNTHMQEGGRSILTAVCLRERQVNACRCCIPSPYCSHCIQTPLAEFWSWSRDREKREIVDRPTLEALHFINRAGEAAPSWRKDDEKSTVQAAWPPAARPVRPLLTVLARTIINCMYNYQLCRVKHCLLYCTVHNY